MTDEQAVAKVEQGVDLATVKGIVLPSRDATPMTKFHKLNIQHLQFRAERGHKVGWKDGQDLFMHANHQLDAIFMAAGAEVLVNEVVTSDDHGDPLPTNVFRHHFAAKIILPSGKVAQADCYKTWDLRSIDDTGTRAMASFRRRQKQLERALAGAKGAKWPKGLAKGDAQETEEEFWNRANPFLEQLVEDEMIERRVFGGELAEAGAKSRVVYDMTGLKMGVPKQEFEQDVWVVTSLFNVEEALEKMAGTKEGQELLALVALAQQQAFGAMGGNGIPGGAEALKLLQAVQGITPHDVEGAIGDSEEEATKDPEREPVEGPEEETIEVRAVEIQTTEIQPPSEGEEPVPADVQALIDEAMAEEMGVAGGMSEPLAKADLVVEEILKEMEAEPSPEDWIGEQLESEADKPELVYRPPAAEPKDTRPITSDELEAMIKYLIWCGYSVVKHKNLLRSLFGEDCTILTINRLQAKI
ncbi:MAG: hypothetical protein KAJ19_13180, partial [Gammaproteobacteria bacterium]|nr:hypothetical protein [Gammaproteobacteria bacterium]